MGWCGKVKSYRDANVFITGGSTGIGLAIAKEFIRLEASVAIVARTQSKLDTAKKELEALITDHDYPGRVITISADVTTNADAHVLCSPQCKNRLRSWALAQSKDVYKWALLFDSLPQARMSFIFRPQQPHDLMNAHNGSLIVEVLAGWFVDQDIDIFERSMQLDYFGSLYVAKSVIPGMLKQNSGQILFITSPLAIAGIAGYSTYAPAKAAVRSLADVLRNELAGTAIKISVGYPLDTDTPGFATENSTKIAAGLVQGLRKEQYHIKTPEFIMNLLISSMASYTPRPYFLLLEILWAPLLVAILAIAGRICDGIVRKERTKLEDEASPLSTQEGSEQEQ